MKPITIGAVGTASAEVTVDNLACTVESGALPVFATPMMAALMEEAACAAVEPYLEEGETTVGTKLDIRHTAATPEGLVATASAEIVGVCGREISFHITVSDTAGEIGTGTHQRFLVDAARFMEKAQQRKSQPQA